MTFISATIVAVSTVNNKHWQAGRSSSIERTTLSVNQTWTARHLLSSDVYCSRDLDLELMTLIYEINLGILKAYLHTKEMNFLGQSIQKLQHEQYRQTNETGRITIRICGWLQVALDTEPF